MYVKAIQSTRGSIFPIIGTVTKSGKYAGRFVAGTGFFINDEGYFATALHVVSGNPAEISYGSLGNIPYAKFKNAQPEPIHTIGQLPGLDLYIGQLKQVILPPIPIVKVNPPEGTSIVIGGYPFPNIKKTSTGGLNFYTVRQYWQSTMIMDYIHLSHLDPSMYYEGFIVDHRTIPGMSGGPAIDLNGNIVGMCTAQITRTAKDKVPHINGVCLDANSLSIGINKILQNGKSNKIK